MGRPWVREGWWFRHAGIPGGELLAQMTTGASVEVRGRLVASLGQKQAWEVQVVAVTLLGAADETYPLRKKRHTLEFLREIARRTWLFSRRMWTRG